MKQLLLLLFLLPFFCTATKIEVCRQCPETSITKAIAKAGRGDTIYIHEGTYREKNIVIQKPLSIIGKNRPVIDGENETEVFSIQSAHVLIEGLRIINSGKSALEDLAAIKVYQSRHVTIRNNELYNNFFGIYLSRSDSCFIQRNVITGASTTEQNSGNGIHLWNSSHSLITHNKVSGHRDGIYFEFVKHSFIRNNLSENNIRYGLHFMFSDNDVYEENIFRNNGAGVAVMFTHHVKMYRNHFELNWGAGSYAILLKEISDSEIIGNTFKGNTTGIFAEGALRIKINDNKFIKNGWALKITSSCDALTLTSNYFSGNTFDMATNGQSPLTENTYHGNYWDKYTGYDMDKDGIGDIPYYPVSLSTMLVEKIPAAVYFLHSFVLNLIDQSEKIVPQLIPAGIRDDRPLMKPAL